MKNAFTILHIIVTILLVVVVMMQEGKDAGMSSISGSSPSAGDSFFSKNSSGTKQAFMTKVTVTLSVLFLITTMSLVLLAS